MVLVQYEMQSVSSRIWTRVAVSFSYDDNHYTTGTSYSRDLIVNKLDVKMTVGASLGIMVSVLC